MGCRWLRCYLYRPDFCVRMSNRRCICCRIRPTRPSRARRIFILGYEKRYPSYLWCHISPGCLLSSLHHWWRLRRCSTTTVRPSMCGHKSALATRRCGSVYGCLHCPYSCDESFFGRSLSRHESKRTCWVSIQGHRFDHDGLGSLDSSMQNRIAVMFSTWAFS